MNVWRCLAWTAHGDVMATEFYDAAAPANERVTFYQNQGFLAVVTEGRRSADGTFEPV